MKNSLFIAMIIMITQTAFSQNEARLMRFPTISENPIAFSYAGDLYIADKSGGAAKRITSGNGYEMFQIFTR